LCEECKTHWEGLLANLTALGVTYKVDPRIVRGLDYYTKTVFEVTSPKLGAQSALWGGGRYDGLMETVGGKPTPGVGFGMGMERVLMALEAEGLLDGAFPGRPRMDVFIATMGETVRPAGLKLLYELRASGIASDIDYMGRSLKAQMKYAGKQNSRFVIILGEDEVKNGVAAVKDMDAGEQQTVPFSDLIRHIQTIG
jgi:histidyl-tRNA synthetase